MKFYILARGEYCGSTDQAFIAGVFSSRDLADANNPVDPYWEKSGKTPEERTFRRYEVVECDLDVPLESEVRIV